MKVSVNINNLTRYALKMRSEAQQLQNIFEEQNANYEMLNLSSVWSGDSEVACLSKYKELSSKYEDIVKKLNSFADMLNTAGLSYEELDSMLSQEADEVGVLPTLDGGGN